MDSITSAQECLSPPKTFELPDTGFGLGLEGKAKYYEKVMGGVLLREYPEKSDDNERNDINALYLASYSGAIVLPSGRKVICPSSSLLPTEIIMQTKDINHENYSLPEKRYYSGISPNNPFRSDSFSIGWTSLQALSTQQYHFHERNPEVVIAIDDLIASYVNPQDKTGLSMILSRGDILEFGTDTIHTIMNTGVHNSRHLCLKFPPIQYGDRKTGEPKLARNEYSLYRKSEDELIFLSARETVRLRVGAAKEQVFDASNFTGLIFTTGPAQLDVYDYDCLLRSEKIEAMSPVYIDPKNSFSTNEGIYLTKLTPDNSDSKEIFVYIQHELQVA